jgi:hypothetical protein
MNQIERRHSYGGFVENQYYQCTSGLFISYHAYPYYPDFVGAQPDYKLAVTIMATNSYLGYIRD